MQRKSVLILLIVALLLSAMAAVQQRPAEKAAGTAAQLPSRETVEAFLRRMFGHDPKATWRIVDIRPAEIPNVAHVIVALGNQPRATHLFVMPGGQHAIVGEVLPFGADPFAAARARLRKEATGPARGPADAAVTLVEFSDLQCPACRQAEPMLEKLLGEDPGIRFVFQHFPLTEIHPWAFQAAAYAECVHRQDAAAFWRFASAVYGAQGEIRPENAAEKLSALAAAAGADATKTAACAATPEAAEAVRRSMQLGRAMGVTGTPTLFLNGRKLSSLGSMPYETLKTMVRFEAEQAKPGK